MHKSDLINAIAKETSLTKIDCEKVVNATLTIITKTLKKKQPVVFIGFGTFKVARVKARKGRNPKTGKEIQIKASNRIRFAAGKNLKEEIN